MAVDAKNPLLKPEIIRNKGKGVRTTDFKSFHFLECFSFVWQLYIADGV